MTAPLTLGERIRLQRERQGWTQQALATRTGISANQISRLENGTITNPGAVRLKAIAQALGVSTDYLLASTAAEAPAAQQTSCG